MAYSLSHIRNEKWYSEKELKRLGAYHSYIFDEDRSLVRKGKEKSVLGASVKAFYGEDGLVSPGALGSALGSHEKVQYLIDHNPDLYDEMSVNGYTVKVIPFRNLTRFNEVVDMNILGAMDLGNSTYDMARARGYKGMLMHDAYLGFFVHETIRDACPILDGDKITIHGDDAMIVLKESDMGMIAKLKGEDVDSEWEDWCVHGIPLGPWELWQMVGKFGMIGEGGKGFLRYDSEEGAFYIERVEGTLELESGTYTKGRLFVLDNEDTMFVPKRCLGIECSEKEKNRLVTCTAIGLPEKSEIDNMLYIEAEKVKKPKAGK